MTVILIGPALGSCCARAHLEARGRLAGRLRKPDRRRVIDYGETAIAEAARPALGDVGFVIVAIAALLATASSLNAVLYAETFVAIVGVAALAVVLDLVWKRIRGPWQEPAVVSAAPSPGG